jgi:hypothetical protein
MSNDLPDACPSIQYRLRHEILKQPCDDPIMRSLQDQILEDALVKMVASWQQHDGWLAWNFHGSISCESGIRILCEKGVDSRNPLLSAALHALESFPDRLNRGIGLPGQILDDLGLGGSCIISASLFARAGLENPLVQKQLAIALDQFKAVTAVSSIFDLIENWHGKPVIKQGLLWPGIYALRLLAWTHTWRTPQNRDLVTTAIQRLVDLSPMPHFFVHSKSHLVAPASFCMDDFNPNLATMDGAGWMMWFHRMEMLARLGVINAVPAIQRQAAALRQILDASRGQFTLKLNHPYFKQWGAYTGLMLESDWRISQRRVNDLTFRSLLILNSVKTQT